MHHAPYTRDTLSDVMDMRFKPITFSAIAAISVATIPSSTPTQVGLQLYSCKRYVATAPEFSRKVSQSDIEVKPVRVKLSGATTINWWIKDGRAAGYCLVDREGKILGYENYAQGKGTLWVRRLSQPYKSKTVFHGEPPLN